EDFSRQKIVWKRVGSILRFSYDNSRIMALDSTCFATGKYIKFLVAILNSKMGEYLMKDSPKTGTGDLLISVQAIEPLKIPIPSVTIEDSVSKIIDSILSNNQNGADTHQLENEIDEIIYMLYDLDESERLFIASQEYK
ncbi:TaqI-like C-terminal specificity domain-containing protein, partial [Sphingobacterium endophyticum]|uniref:TaqI-like C-terminal specificity domain-containing protein n=1 Tax=Sphingobacterium endophyticum TaxID=2546448 RepID=UPI0018CDA6C9